MKNILPITLLALAFQFTGCSREPKANQVSTANVTNNATTTQETPPDLTKNDKTPGPITNLKGIEGFRLPDDALLITSGFPYDTNLQVSMILNVDDSGDIEKLKFNMFLASEQLSADGKFVSRLANTCLGITWSFKKSQTSFRVGDYVYTSTSDGSTVEFNKEGVLLKGFKVTVLSDFIKSHSKG